MILLGEGRRPLKLVHRDRLGLLGVSSRCSARLGRTRTGRWPICRQLAGAVRDRAGGRPALGRRCCCSPGSSALRARSSPRPAGTAPAFTFQPLFQLQLMGLSGAFLTADIFNLFVFFEILLAASYGLLLHGSGEPRVRASVHYVAVNLAPRPSSSSASSMIYGVTGTLNMAELAARLSGRLRREPAPHRRGRRHPRRGLPDQGRRLAAQLLARSGLLNVVRLP